ncbi:MAG: 16S rRNA (adenine(1518)-N(6)/adenine(1519)-N(6))-dimethyltransferase [Tenericutes bacterium HGW-Tenericutes-4]|nr:MAG: 16S rRNA (adenine(1518)-N(6)/adenine(1519)-N(6))-dimethyltransferase [Tenericutes bacterium HGW-Tenericutes-4]
MENKVDTSQKFVFKKQFGQNFLTDKNLLKAIVSDAQITSEDEVLEIGPGAGSLTYELCSVAKKVVCYEIDKDLKTLLDQKLREFNNVEIIFKDILKVDVNEIKSQFKAPFKVVANLPYYITTPIIFLFLENNFDIKSLTVMVQKEVAERLTAKESTKEYGTITVSANIKSNVKITRNVSRKLFYPTPNVDSAILHFELKNNKFDVENWQVLNKLIKASFAMRRKTLFNNLKQAFMLPPETLKQALRDCNLDENIRGESLNLDEFVKLSNILTKYL